MPLPSLHKAKQAKSPVNSTSNFQTRKLFSQRGRDSRESCKMRVACV